MRKNKLLKLGSIVLAAATAASSLCVSLGRNNKVLAAEPMYIDTDFDVEVGAEKYWDTFYTKDDLTLDFGNGNVTTSGTGDKILTLKDGVINDDETLKSISYTIESKNTYAPRVVFAEKDGSVCYLRAANFPSGMYQGYLSDEGVWSPRSEGASDPSSGWLYVGSNFSSIINSKVMKVEVEFGENISVTLGMADGSYAKTFTYKDETLKAAVGIYLTQNVTLKDLKVTVTKPVDYRQTIEAFKTNYAGLFSKNQITLDDETQINACKAEYDALPVEVREELYTYGLKLNSFVDNIAALKAGESYDLSDLSLLHNWEFLNGSYKDAVSENGSINLKPSSDKNSPIIMKLSDDYVGDNVLKKISYRLKKENPKSEAGLRLIYDYTDSKNYKFLSVWWNTNKNYYIAQYWTYSTDKNYVTQTNINLNIDLEDVWVSFDYSTGGKVVLKLESNSGNYTWNLSTSNPAYIISSISTKESVNVSEITALAVSEDDADVEQKTIDRFKSTYNEILSLSDNMIAVNYKAAVNAAILEYNSLSYYSQKMLLSEKQILDALLAKINELEASGVQPKPERAADSYSEGFYDYFENGLYKWSNTSAPKNPPEIVYDDIRGSNVLKLQGGSIVVPNSFSYPQKAFVKSLSYKLRYEGTISNIWYSLKIPIYYVDSKNYSTVVIFRQNDSDTKLSYRIDTIKDGNFSNTAPKLTSLECHYDDTWLDVGISYTTNGKATIEISDGTVTDILTCDSLVNGKIALAGAGNSTYKRTTYFDNVEAELQQGTWEEDLEIDTINIYYTGNTGAKADNVVTLAGEKLEDTLARAYIMRVDEKDLSVPSYTVWSNFQQSGNASQFIVSENADSVWNELIASGKQPQRLKLLQKNQYNVKFVIPKELGDGIYAVKLEGYNALSTEDDKVIFINTPKISFVQGSDGSACKPGGKLSIVGENLALYDKRADNEDFVDDKYQTDEYINDKVKVFLKSANAEYLFSGDDITVKSEQYISVNLPYDIKKGDYEVFVYNGFGGTGSWSMPCDTLLKVEASPYESWPQKVFNVKDFGATGDRNQNATGCVADALTAAAENGGGIVYFPKGIYNLIHSIVIPEKVQIVGDGHDDSILLWTPDQWKIGNCPTYLCAFSGNVVFKDMGFYGTRSQAGFKSFDLSDDNSYGENVYFINTYFQFNAQAGNATGGNTTAPSTGKYTDAELRLILDNEAGKFNGIDVTKIDNLRFENINFSKTLGKPVNISGRNTYIGNSYIWQGWTTIGGHTNSIVEYTDFAQCTVAPEGNGRLYYACEFADRRDNNRELAVADGYPEQTGGKANVVVRKDSSDATGCTYVMQGATFNAGKIIGWQIYISDGQGSGQTRIITANSGNKLVINNPFVIEPNSNCRVVIRNPREDTYWVNNRFYNGACCGYYGGFANIVYYNNLYERVSDIYQMARWNDMNWYLTHQGNVFIDHFSIHNYGTGTNDWTGFSHLRMFGDKLLASRTHTFRNCDFDGYSFVFDTTGITNAIIGVTFDKNTFRDMDTVFSSNLGSVGSTLMYKNELLNVGGYAPTALSSNCLVLEEEYVDGEYDVGDINGDGKKTIKDVTYIKLYLAGLIELDEHQLERADFYADGNVTMRDSTALRHYLLTGERLDPVGGSSGEESSSEESSSEESSSSESSSSESSSSSSSESSSSENSSSLSGTATDNSSGMLF